ncbi:MAG: hypothetical protein V1738_02905 [Patescibacteria group bacterium]
MSDQTSAMTPLVEAVVNGMEAIFDSKIDGGCVTVEIIRKGQSELQVENDGLLPITGFIVSDNGTGFGETNRESFNTVFSDMKLKIGGKGFGRFSFLKYFGEVRVESIFQKGESLYKRTFDFGRNHDIIINETVRRCSEGNSTGSSLYLETLRKGLFDKKVDTIARKLLENILVYFINDERPCPKIVVKDHVTKEEIILNDLLEEKKDIQLIGGHKFVLETPVKNELFLVKVFKIYYPGGFNNLTQRIPSYPYAT